LVTLANFEADVARFNKTLDGVLILTLIHGHPMVETDLLKLPGFTDAWAMDSSCYGTFQSDGGTKKFIQFIDDHDLVLKPMVLGTPHFKNPLIIFLLKYVEVPDVWGAALFHGR
jgi:hypothetical protein